MNIERNLGLERYLLITPSMQPIQRRNTIDTRSQIPQPVVVANVTNPRPATISRRSTTDTRRQLPQTPPRNLLKAKEVASVQNVFFLLDSRRKFEWFALILKYVVPIYSYIIFL